MNFKEIAELLLTVIKEAVGIGGQLVKIFDAPEGFVSFCQICRRRGKNGKSPAVILALGKDKVYASNCRKHGVNLEPVVVWLREKLKLPEKEAKAKAKEAKNAGGDSPNAPGGGSGGGPISTR